MSYIQKLIDAQSNIVIICDKKFNIKNINQAFYNLFKKKRLKEIIEHVKHKEFNEAFKLKIKNFEGHRYTFLVKLTKVEDDIVINMDDITKKDAYYKSIISSNASFVEYKKLVEKFLIISKTDKDGKITYVNENFIKISGYTKDELIGKSHNIVRHPDMPSYVFRNLWKVITQGKIWQGVIKNRKKNGNSYFVKTMVAPMFNSNGEIKEYIAFRVDITKLIKATEEAQRAKKAKELFLANMSHEIRTPLTGVIGFIDILKRKNLDDEAKHIVDVISNSADMLLNIVNDILDISKIENDGVTIYPTKFDAKSSFFNTIELFIARAKEKNIDYIANVDIDSCIISDEYRLKQVLSNLIGNSIKFTPENGEVKIDIKATDIDEKYIKVDFSIKDTGIGIPKEKQKKLFKIFSQIGDNKFGGTGLGLYISSQIVNKLGGKIKVESQEGKGSEFYFSLKFEKCEKITKEIQKDIKVKGKILIAEDNQVNQELLKALLDIRGNIEYEIVENGKEAIKLFKKDNFDLVFMDIFMPIMNGDEAVKKILEYEKENNLTHTPIIALTANALSGDKEKFLEEGFDGYISKPIKNEELDGVLAKYLKEDLLGNIALNLDLDEEIIKELIDLYFQNIYSDLDLLKKAIEENDYKNIREIAHKIAGGSSAVGFDKAYKKAKIIENFAKDEEKKDYRELFKKLNGIIKQYNLKVDF